MQLSAPTDKQTSDAVAALVKIYEDKVFTEFDRRTCSPEAIRDFRHLLGKRLVEEKSLPTTDEVDGIKIMALDILHYHPERPEVPYGKGII